MPDVVPATAIVARLRAAGCVFAEDEARLLASAAASQAELDAMVRRRAEGLPIEHVVGWADFCGLRLDVDPGVFVPRRRTEFLARRAAALARGAAALRRLVVVDLCCGSGAVGVALAAALARPGGHGSELHAVDIDPRAVDCARRNVGAAGGTAYLGDLYEPLPAWLAGRVDVLVANVPYVPTGEVGLLPAEARLHEARVALDGGPDGLDVLRRVAAGAPSWLAPAGIVLTETSARQAARAAGIVRAAGFAASLARSQEAEATVVIGRSAS